jgi:hypothetical protein
MVGGTGVQYDPLSNVGGLLNWSSRVVSWWTKLRPIYLFWSEWWRADCVLVSQFLKTVS